MKNKKLIVITALSLLLSIGQVFIPALRGALSSVGGFAMGVFSGESQSYDSPFLFRNKEVDRAIGLFRGDGREFFSRALSNSGRYLERIKSIFRAEGMPPQLAYLALIESGYNNNALSRASAVGMWQFMAATGRGYGLRVGYLIDERRDFIKATRAAARHLKDLYNRFGDWYLALAAYNSGAGYIESRIALHGTRDFWRLAPHLYTETKLYVPRFLAACLIGNNPSLFGFADHEYGAPVHFARTTVRRRTTLAALALRHGVPVEQVRRANPHLIRGIIPASRDGIGVNIPLIAGQSRRSLATLAEITGKRDKEGNEG